MVRAVLLLFVATFVIGLMFGFPGAVLAQYVLPVFGSFPLAIAARFIMDVAMTALECWLAVVVLAKMGQLKYVTSATTVAFTVSLLWLIYSTFFYLPFILSGTLQNVDGLAINLSRTIVDLIVTFFALHYFLTRYVESAPR